MEDIEKFFVQRRGWPRTIINEFIDEAVMMSPIPTSTHVPHVEIVNLSQAGAGVLLSERLDKGTHVRLQVSGKRIPGFNVDAEVRWAAASPVSTGKYPIGLKFMSIDEENRSKLVSLFKALREYRTSSERSDDN
jgi:hypothetical protein